MRVVCSWCFVQGNPAWAQVRAPLGDERATDGICASHRLEVPIGRSLLMLERRGRL